MKPMPIVYAAISLCFLVLWPATALAWGPGMHVDIASEALASIALLAPIVREVIEQYPNAFIYGAASPDIVVGKKFAGYQHHCHNWHVGSLILSEAESDLQRAAAYGYLMHLAADVVAHNYYIPVKYVRSYGARLLSHTYWEMRFDLGVSEEVWARLDAVTEEEVDQFDRLLESVLKKTLFSFSTNKRIFNTILILQKMRGLRTSLRLYAKRSRYGIPEENREHYRDLAVESALDLLKNPTGAPCLAMEPMGIQRIAYAKNLRRRIRAMLMRGMMTEVQAERLVELVRERLAVGLYRPDLALPDVVDIL